VHTATDKKLSVTNDKLPATSTPVVNTSVACVPTGSMHELTHLEGKAGGGAQAKGEGVGEAGM